MATARFGDNTNYTMDYPGTQDTTIWSGEVDNNAGAAHYLIIGDHNETDPKRYRVLIAFDLKSFNDDHPDATISAARLKLYVAQYNS